MKLAIGIRSTRDIYGIFLPLGLNNLQPCVADWYKRRDKKKVQLAREMHTKGKSKAEINAAIAELDK